MISVIVPSYNQAEYLPDCLDSLLDQNVQGEILIVDDKSTDKSLAIAKKYQDKRPDVIRVIEHEVNKGLSASRNTGIANAKYDYFLPVDADDMLLPNCLEKILVTIRQTNADMVAPSFKCFGLNQAEVILMQNPKLEDFRSGNRIGYCTAMRKSKVLEVGGYSESMRWGYEDMSLACKMLAKGASLVTIPEVLWLYRVKPQSMITTAREHHQELLDIINSEVPEAQLNFEPR